LDTNKIGLIKIDATLAEVLCAPPPRLPICRQTPEGSKFTFYEKSILFTVIFPTVDFKTSSSSPTMNAPDRFELFILPDGVKKYEWL